MSSTLERLDGAGVPCSLVRSVGEAVRDENFRARGGIWTMVGRYGEVETIASPVRLSASPARLERAAPALGEHGAEIEAEGWRTR